MKPFDACPKHRNVEEDKTATARNEVKWSMTRKRKSRSKIAFALGGATFVGQGEEEDASKHGVFLLSHWQRCLASRSGECGRGL